MVSAERAAALRNTCLSLAKTCSIGFRSGEYFGSKELGPGCADELAHRFGFVTTEIVHDHDVAGAKRGDDDLLDIDPEAPTVDWTVEYRAMIHEVFAPGMHNRAYYHRYTDDNVDLCGLLS